jgi:hypothetical protein
MSQLDLLADILQLEADPIKACIKVDALAEVEEWDPTRKFAAQVTLLAVEFYMRHRNLTGPIPSQGPESDIFRAITRSSPE